MEFGGSGITKELFDWFLNNIPFGGKVLELGAGHVSTKYLSERYIVYSVEDKSQFLNIYHNNYIHAPIDPNTNWYSVDSLVDRLPLEYDCILVDGPAGEGNRWGFYLNIDLFNNNIPIVIDDTWRKAERNLLTSLARKVGRPYMMFENFGVILSR
jgi:hypothetical protein